MAMQTSNRIGVPRAEKALTEALIQEQSRLMRPGPGRSRVFIAEVGLGVGRPDALLISISLTGLIARKEVGLRLPNLSHARVLDSIRAGRGSRYSKGHERLLTGELLELGWINRRGEINATPNLIHQSLLVEAKIADWRTGIRQLSRARWAAEHAALLLPREAQHRVPRATLKHNRIGLLSETNGSIKWQIRPPRKTMPWFASIWLTELAIRAHEAGGFS